MCTPPGTFATFVVSNLTRKDITLVPRANLCFSLYWHKPATKIAPPQFEGEKFRLVGKVTYSYI